MFEPYDYFKHTAHANAWEHANGRSLFRLSDWNCARDDVVLPDELYEQAAQTAFDSLTRYAETSSLLALGEQIHMWLREGYGAEIDANSAVHLYANSTQALFGVIYALRELQQSPKALLLHPSYYSVHDALALFHIPYSVEWRKVTEMGEVFLDRVEELRRKYAFNTIFLTDPMYSTGIRLQSDNWSSLIEYCASHDIWLVVDMAFSGLSWNDYETGWQDLNALARGGYDKCIVVDSPSKRLFTNNLKLSLVHSSRAVSVKMEKFSDSFTGNLTGMQHAFARSLYDPANRRLIESICMENALKISKNYECLEKIVRSSDKLDLIRPHSGFHTMIFARDYTSGDVDSMKVCRRLVVENEVYALPTHDYFYHKDDPFGIRLNLTMQPSKWDGFVSSIARSGLT